MRRRPILALLLLSIFSLLLISAGDPPPTTASPEIQAELFTAFALRLQSSAESKPLAFDLFTPEIDTAFLTPDGKTAVIWVALRDENGRVKATEPGLALGLLTASGWKVLLSGDAGWDELWASLPDGMLPLEQSPDPAGYETKTADTQALMGYYLPYAAGTARLLEGSIGHVLIYNSCFYSYECWYAYDFGDTLDQHFPLLASKDGTVYGDPYDGCTNGDPNCTNYIVLKNASEGTYQIYIHIANGTIPDKLTNGESVKRGQYLGDTDDTGFSTNNHVHFMVTKNIRWGNGYYWGTSIDIRFADVPINNGIPRTCYEAYTYPGYNGAYQCSTNPATDMYTSGNIGAYPPTGTLTRPLAGATVNIGTNPLIDVTAKTSDDVHVEAVRLLAKINGQWTEVGPKITQAASPNLYDWDANLCDVGALNGPLEVALRAWDHEGNASGPLDPHTINVDHACPPPTSQINSAETTDSTALRLSWGANSPYAPVGSFELQWRIEPGTWDPAQTLTFPADVRSTWFIGQPGVTFGFRLRAFDVNGQAEPWPANDAPEITAVPPTCTDDSFEPDDDVNHARFLAQGILAQANLCGVGDPDWYRIDAPAAGYWRIDVASLGGNAAVTTTVYASNGTTILARGLSPGLGQAAFLLFHAPGAGSYYLTVEPLPANLVGTGALYGVTIAETKVLFLPTISH